MSCRLTFAAALLIASSPARAAPLDPSAVAQAYAALQSYCDEVVVTEQGLELSFRRCFAADGRYKVHEIASSAGRHQRIWWGDRSRAYFWSGRDVGWRGTVTTHYSEGARWSAREGGEPEGLFAGMLNLFLPGASDEAGGRDVLRGFDADVACATPELRCFRRSATYPAGTVVTKRLTLRDDGLVASMEELWDGRMHRSAILRTVRLDAAAPEELVHTPPFLDRFSLQNRPVAFIGGLAAMAFMLGLLGALATARRAAVWSWTIIWMRYAKAGGVTVAGLGVFALLMLPVGGHPPGIIIPIILAVFAGVAFVALAALLLGAQLGGRIARRFSSGP